MEDELYHYGTKYHSGRYPYGSGEIPYQHDPDFLGRYEAFKNQGLSESEIAEAMGCGVRDLRAQLSNAKAERKNWMLAANKSMIGDGITNRSERARRLGISEGTLRSLENEERTARRNVAKTTADILRKSVKEKGMIDIGAGVELELGITRTKFDQAVNILKDEGYEVYGGRIPQVTNKGKDTTLKVLCPPGTEHKDIYNYDKIGHITNYVSHDNGLSYDPKFVYPESMSSKRLQICYAEDGGIKKDGLVEIRRGVDDLSLGNLHYAQVRIMVDGTHYIKGMAVYSDDLPEGVDVRFNTNKTKDIPMSGVLKKIKDDPTNPFGSLIKEGIIDPDKPYATEGGQSYYYDKDGNKKLSLINKRAEEGDWDAWADKLPSQFLGKQPMQLINRQLDISKESKRNELNEIMALENPTIKKAMLEKYASGCDSDAEHLKAAALPRQKYQVIIPLTSIRDDEIYAPNYNDGEQVALIRYPHAGTFEIPILTVNNGNREGRKVLTPSPTDAVGINKKVADRLSGADFDGDTVMVIPTGGSVNIKSTPALQGLKDFDPSTEYPYKDGIKLLGKEATQKEMGVISNLITDMTLKGAAPDELAKAVRHSMVVIDANKHSLDYTRSYQENDIALLKKKYQGVVEDDGRYHEGAGTLLSRAKSETSVLKRQGQPKINPDGTLSYKVATDLTYIDRKGNVVERTQRSTKMAETSDAMTLVSKERTPQELAYANYANYMKELAKEARRGILNTVESKADPVARKEYASEVESLEAKLTLAQLNKPRERSAQIIATSIVKSKREANPDMTKQEVKKAEQMALTEARVMVGAKRTPIDVNEREWQAIQNHAISPNKLSQIINYIDDEKLKELATPRESRGLTPVKINRLKTLYDLGYTQSEIAKELGVSASLVNDYLSDRR